MQEAVKINDFFKSKKPLLLVLGNESSDRSELLAAARDLATTDQMILRIKGKSSFEPSALIHSLKKHWAIKIRKSDKPLNEKLNDAIACLEAQQQSCILLIDQAHLLPISMLAALCHLSHQQEGHTISIRIILAGVDSLATKIQALYLKNFAPPPIIKLNPKQQTTPKKQNPANEKSFWQHHRIKSLAAVGLIACSFTLYKVEQNNLPYTHHPQFVKQQKHYHHA